MTQPDEQSPQEAAPHRHAPGYNKGDVLNEQWGEPPSWFGYIGVGIALAAMAVGIVGMVFVVRIIIWWIQK